VVTFLPKEYIKSAPQQEIAIDQRLSARFDFVDPAWGRIPNTLQLLVLWMHRKLLQHLFGWRLQLDVRATYLLEWQYKCGHIAMQCLGLQFRRL
jgi:hypothetical protein